ncbi:helix-turn-helix domain-containing protein [Leptospira sp. 201903071]|uniref:helix-turn-helix domain-containing protein n=1 Tax=Leptospira ainazelensis TaxID=2810034 RepID=UPI001965E6DC|nr:helix-turn-helix domain-containing protein [Leptospira ainazelensis]MBM9499354.1 helix-turn-helix domain-containing protein [Leptospira ainazelensis]
MSEIKGNTRKGSLLKVAQSSFPIGDGKPAEEQEFPIPAEKNKALKTKEAAKYLNLSVRTFTQYVIDYEIPFIQWSPRVRRFFASDLDKVVLSLKTKKQIY